ncbi:MAG: hypothetical protein KH345_11790 [Eubacterium sp.]|nr:hypothetical protein [Eubacterium sp.]
MKKILSLGVAAAVVSLTAVAASAAIAPAFDTDAPVAGETLTVQVVANGMTQEATTFTVNASEGLTLTANEAVTGGIFSTETNKFAWAGTAVPADGTVLLTLTYTVDAAADAEVSVSLTPDAGFTDISADAVAAVVVAGASTDVPNVTVETTETVETVESTEQPGVVTTDEEKPATEDTKPADDGKGNPGTGVALAVVPAVLAGAAIVVAKKRK